MKPERLRILFWLWSLLLFVPPDALALSPASPWPLWHRFTNRFLQGDGRVIDRTDHDRTTSEGEAYVLFFSLVAGDRATFGRVHSWIRNNLAHGDLEHRLPSWLWGRRPDGKWGVLDVNSASDADSWIAYSLIEAGRLWKDPSFEREGRHLLFLIRKNETRFLPGFGWALLPGPWGFVLPDGTIRLNPSYTPFEILSLFHSVEPGGPWEAIMAAFASHLPAIAPRGFAPDWFAVKKGGRILPDPVKGPGGSYDAIRVYLWAGLLPAGEAFRSALLDRLEGMEAALAFRPAPPLSVDTVTGKGTGNGPPGFSAALLPYLRATGHRNAFLAQLGRLQNSERDGLYGSPPAYYDQILALFAQGSLSGRFAFDPSGRLRPASQN